MNFQQYDQGQQDLIQRVLESSEGENPSQKKSVPTVFPTEAEHMGEFRAYVAGKLEQLRNLVAQFGIHS